jgi:hypothetical protein
MRKRSPSRRPTVGDVLVRCLREPDAGAPSQELVDLLAGIDLDALVDLAAQHGLVPLLGVLLRDAELPQHLSNTLKVGRYGQLIRHQIVMEELSLVRAALDGADIPWLVMKGPVLSECCYPRPDLRTYGDLDLLVPPAQFAAAIDALCDGGATLVDRNWPLAHRQMRGELTLTLPRGTVVDLHWHVLNEPEARQWFPLDPTAMVARRRTVTLGPGQASTMDPEDTLLHLAVHTLLNGMRRLVWLNDVRMAHNAFRPDHALLLERARRAGLELGLAAVTQRTARLLGATELEPLARPRHGATWLRMLRAVDRVRPPQAHGTGGLSLAHVVWSTRSTAPASAVALAGWAARGVTEFAREPDHPLRQGGRRRPPAQQDTNPLHVPEGGPSDRRRYLDAVASFRPR